MIVEARITVHQKGHLKPDYNDIHARMKRAGYDRQLQVGGQWLSELHGMYRKHTSYTPTTLAAEKVLIERELQMTGFSFSIELFEVAGTTTFNLEEAPNYAAMLGLFAAGRR